ncbi:MAG: hypothetical protein HJJLKODD_02449 [Phycisphaerae bacterium]|nr:hypothetical protein [Phycisphaerae bacterium]
MGNRHFEKLTIVKESLRNLNSAQLHEVKGGASPTAIATSIGSLILSAISYAMYCDSGLLTYRIATEVCIQREPYGGSVASSNNIQ